MDTGWITDDMWNNPDQEGTLGMIGGLFAKTITNKYFRLQDRRLFYFNSEDDDTPSGNIPLTNIKIHTNDPFVTKYGKNCFCIDCEQYNTQYFLVAKNAKERNLWTEALLATDVPSTEIVRTLFITGLPPDVKEREIHNLFRTHEKYEGCRLGSGNPPVAFANFTDRKAAEEAKQIFQGIRFDPHSPVTLRIVFAKSNSKVKRLPPGQFFVNRKVSSRSITETINDVPTLNEKIDHISLTPPEEQKDKISPRRPPVKQNPPCSTIFIANLHPNTLESDLRRLFSVTPGFLELKMYYGKDASPVCFVDYKDIQSSTYSMEWLQGIPFGPTTLRIEYAKKKMGGNSSGTEDSECSDVDFPPPGLTPPPTRLLHPPLLVPPGLSVPTSLGNIEEEDF